MKARAHATENQRRMDREARNDSADTVLDRYYATDSRDKGLAWTGSVSFSWTDSHALVAGWDTGYGKLREQEVQDDVKTGSGPVPIDFDNSFSASIHRIALYVQDEWEVSSGLSAYAGVRWEGVDIRTAGAGARAVSRSRVLSPLMQLLWKIPGSGKDQLRFALTRTYKAPDLGRLIPRQFYTSFNSAVTPDFTGNPQLKPELAFGVDLAYERYWKSGGMVSASASVRRIDGLVRSAVRYDGSRWVSYPENSGEGLVRNVELEARFPLATLIAKAPAVDLRASVSRNWSQVDTVPGPDNRLARQPRWSANFGADYKSGPFSSGASLALVSGGWNRLSLAEWAYVSQRTELQAYALYQIMPGRQLRFTLSNLRPRDRTSATRYADANGSLESRTVADSHASWRLQYEHKF
jgi:outer membrane receptor for ferrienterochelin and colicins